MEAATAPQVERLSSGVKREPAGLTLSAGGGQSRQAPPLQPPLFPDPVLRKVIGFDDYLPVSAPRRSYSGRSRPNRRREIPGQTSFDFDALAVPAAETGSRRCNLPVAPLALRALATMADASLILLLMAVFLVTVRLLLGNLPLGPFAFAAGAVALLVVAMLYKLLWGILGRPTPGLQATGLRIVTVEGRAATPDEFLKRFFGGMLSFGCAAVGELWALIDQESFTWNDYISQTFITWNPQRQ